jgi:hypothetical protein
MYVGYGVLLAIAVRMQGCRYFSTVCDDQQMHYTVALAFILEGTLSAAYHICPTSNTLQYDYLGISLLLITLLITICAKRHACPPSALVVFLCFSYLYAMILWSERIQWIRANSGPSTERTAFLVLAALSFILVGPLCLIVYTYFYASTEFRDALWEVYLHWRGANSSQLPNRGLPSAPALAANTIDASFADVVVRATEAEMRDRGANAETSSGNQSLHLQLFKRTASDSVHSFSPSDLVPQDHSHQATGLQASSQAGSQAGPDPDTKPPPRSPAAIAIDTVNGAVGVAMEHAVDDTKETARNFARKIPHSAIMTLMFGASQPSVSANPF